MRLFKSLLDGTFIFVVRKILEYLDFLKRSFGNTSSIEGESDIDPHLPGVALMEGKGEFSANRILEFDR